MRQCRRACPSLPKSWHAAAGKKQILDACDSGHAKSRATPNHCLIHHGTSQSVCAISLSGHAFYSQHKPRHALSPPQRQTLYSNRQQTLNHYLSHTVQFSHHRKPGRPTPVVCTSNLAGTTVIALSRIYQVHASLHARHLIINSPSLATHIEHSHKPGCHDLRATKSV